MEINWTQYSNGLVLRNRMSCAVKQQAFHLVKCSNEDLTTTYRLFFLVLVLKPGSVAITAQHPHPAFQELDKGNLYIGSVRAKNLYYISALVLHCMFLQSSEQKALMIK